MPFIENILDAGSESELCEHLREYIDTLKTPQSLRHLPEAFHDLTADDATDIEGWYEALRDTEESQDSTKPLKDVYDHFHGAILTLRRLGLRHDD